MGAIYLDWLADELRAVGLHVVEVDHVSGQTVVQGPAWKRRARSSGGYSALPLCVMWHHTAVSATRTSIANVLTHGIATSDARPVYNLLIWPDGTVYVCAGGATNTNGAGRAMTFSRGTVPVNSMNSYAVGMEIMNDGVGEPYPSAQMDAAFATSNVINRRCGNRPDDLAGHWDYAPTRKVDPARGSAVLGAWRPRSVNTSGTWHVGDLRDEAQRRVLVAPPVSATKPPATPTKRGSMSAVVIAASDGSTEQRSAWFWWDGTRIGWVRSPAQLDVGRWFGLYLNVTSDPLLNFSAADIQMMIDSGWSGGPIPPGYA